MGKIISIIAAVSDNWAIGRGGDMPWHLSEDLRYFKRVTSGNTVIMGRRTWESIGCRPLPNRQNIVISRTMNPVDGVQVAGSIDEAVGLAVSQEVFIIGGGSIYAGAAAKADKLYLTEVHKDIPDADTFFPKVDFSGWKEVFRSEKYHDAGNDVDFEFVQYERIKYGEE